MTEQATESIANLKSDSQNDGSEQFVHIDLRFDLPAIGPEDVSWREGLDALRGYIARLSGKVVKEDVEEPSK